MQTRRRKKKSGTPPTPTRSPAETAALDQWNKLPKLNSWCSRCQAQGLMKARQHMSPHGPVCAFGHGGAAPVAWDDHDAMTVEPGYDDEAEARAAVQAAVEDFSPPADFKVRKGDTLTIKFDGANLQIAKYTSVKLDSAIYSRQLQPGDDPDAEYDRIYEYLRRKCLAKAKQKLADFADEHRTAQQRATGK